MNGHYGCAHNRDGCIDRSPSNRVHAVMHTHTTVPMCVTIDSEPYLCAFVLVWNSMSVRIKAVEQKKSAYGKRPAIIMSEFIASKGRLCGRLNECVTLLFATIFRHIIFNESTIYGQFYIARIFLPIL